MKRIVTLALLATLATAPVVFTAAPVLAATAAVAACSTAPESSWKPQAELEAQLTAEGLKVLQIKVENGCYEVYAVDKDGNKVNAAYNAETFEKVGDAEAGEN